MKQASRVMVSTFGTLVGLAGIEHGLGEILQGGAAPAAMVFPSWPQSEFFRSLNGEPAFSLIPNLLLTGLLAVFVSLLFIACSIRLTPRRHCAWILIGLSVVLLLTGGGIFPPVFGILVGVGAFRLNSRKRDPRIPACGFLSRGWPWLFALSLVSWFAMLPGVPALEYFFGVEQPILTFILLVCMFGFLILSWIAAGMRDRDPYADRLLRSSAAKGPGD
ncbi:MAG: hypothetical protein JW929_02990 [Anaerolineales bacterium]|nr:hypothetical protein [Anaerolineales bacterium]